MKKNSKKTFPKRKKLESLLMFPEVQSWRTLMAAFKSILTILEKGLVSENCSVSRFQILFYLYFEGDLAAVTIARKLVVTRGNITMFLRRLEADGLIKPIVPKGQKRAVFTLTKKGAALFERIFPSHIKRVRQFAPVLSQDTIRLLKAVHRVNEF
ncbi:MAG: MarR family winged helix-turn-helix transcriptional regulator [Pseudobdellovibrionaceae bacterium]